VSDISSGGQAQNLFSEYCCALNEESDAFLNQIARARRCGAMLHRQNCSKRRLVHLPKFPVPCVAAADPLRANSQMTHVIFVDRKHRPSVSVEMSSGLIVDARDTRTRMFVTAGVTTGQPQR
jgi:hypothetical protein